MKARILVVDDEKEMCWAVKKNLERRGFESHEANTGEEALENIAQETYHMVILDYKMPGMDGLEALTKIKQLGADAPRVIFMTAFGDDELAMKSLEMGADDFLHKPFDMKNLLFRVRKLLKFHILTAEIETIRKNLRASQDNILAECSEMKSIMNKLDRIAASDGPVMIHGQTGTGKEVIAKAVYNSPSNPRKDYAFITVNSAALPETLMESELFGHAKGAFTGAMTAKRGLFEAADGGTIFLDEISSAPMSLQSKLLRVLDSGEMMRVGDTRSRKVDVRVITATNKNLRAEVEEGNFREDLFHRLNVLKIDLPPLHKRGGDIELFIEYFLNYFNKKNGKNVVIEKSAAERLASYKWPGNVRELKHCIERMVLLADGGLITTSDLPERMKDDSVCLSGGSFTEQKNRAVAEFERSYFNALIKDAEGNVSKAARNADMNRAYLIKKLKEYGIDPKEA